MDFKKMGSLAAGIALAAAIAPHAAFADDRPTYASHDEDTVKGRIVALTGQYDVTVRDDRGFVDHVRMHQGTIINPNGLTLAPGMTVTILGVNEGSVLAANEIDTPYDYTAAAPVYVPDYAVYGYGYPGYYGGYYPYRFGYGYPYGYPGVAIGFNFGGYGYGGYHHGGYGGYHYGGYNHGGYGGYNHGGYGGYHGGSGNYGGARGGFGGGGSRGGSGHASGGGGHR